jgi:hypothetical protein
MTVHSLNFLTSVSLILHQRPHRPWRPPRGPPLFRPYLSLLSSSLRDVAPPPAQLSSRIRVAALVGRQLAGQPERRRHRLRMRWRRRLRRLGRLMGGGSHRYHRFQPRSLAGWLGGLAVDDVCHHFPGGDSGGVRGEMHPVSSPDAGPVDGGQFLRVRLERTKKL